MSMKRKIVISVIMFFSILLLSTKVNAADWNWNNIKELNGAIKYYAYEFDYVDADASNEEELNVYKSFFEDYEEPESEVQETISLLKDYFGMDFTSQEVYEAFISEGAVKKVKNNVTVEYKGLKSKKVTLNFGGEDLTFSVDTSDEDEAKKKALEILNVSKFDENNKVVVESLCVAACAMKQSGQSIGSTSFEQTDKIVQAQFGFSASGSEENLDQAINYNTGEYQVPESKPVGQYVVDYVKKVLAKLKIWLGSTIVDAFSVAMNKYIAEAPYSEIMYTPQEITEDSYLKTSINYSEEVDTSSSKNSIEITLEAEDTDEEKSEVEAGQEQEEEAITPEDAEELKIPVFIYSIETIVQNKIGLFSSGFLSEDAENNTSDIWKTFREFILYYFRGMVKMFFPILGLLIATTILLSMINKNEGTPIELAEKNKKINNVILKTLPRYFAVFFVVTITVMVVTTLVNVISANIASDIFPIRANVEGFGSFNTNVEGVIRFQIQGQNLNQRNFYYMMYLLYFVFMIIITYLYIKALLAEGILMIMSCVALIRDGLSGTSEQFIKWVKGYFAVVSIRLINCIIYNFLIYHNIKIATTNIPYFISVIALMIFIPKVILDKVWKECILMKEKRKISKRGVAENTRYHDRQSSNDRPHIDDGQDKNIQGEQVQAQEEMQNAENYNNTNTNIRTADQNAGTNMYKEEEAQRNVLDTAKSVSKVARDPNAIKDLASDEELMKNVGEAAGTAIGVATGGVGGKVGGEIGKTIGGATSKVAQATKGKESDDKEPSEGKKLAQDLKPIAEAASGAAKIANGDVAGGTKKVVNGLKDVSAKTTNGNIVNMPSDMEKNDIQSYEPSEKSNSRGNNARLEFLARRTLDRAVKGKGSRVRNATRILGSSIRKSKIKGPKKLKNKNKFILKNTGFLKDFRTKQAIKSRFEKNQERAKYIFESQKALRDDNQETTLDNIAETLEYSDILQQQMKEEEEKRYTELYENDPNTKFGKKYQMQEKIKYLEKYLDQEKLKRQFSMEEIAKISLKDKFKALDKTVLSDEIKAKLKEEDLKNEVERMKKIQIERLAENGNWLKIGVGVKFFKSEEAREVLLKAFETIEKRGADEKAEFIKEKEKAEFFNGLSESEKSQFIGKDGKLDAQKLLEELENRKIIEADLTAADEVKAMLEYNTEDEKGKSTQNEKIEIINRKKR